MGAGDLSQLVWKQQHLLRHKPASTWMGLMLLYCLTKEVLHAPAKKQGVQSYVCLPDACAPNTLMARYILYSACWADDTCLATPLHDLACLFLLLADSCHAALCAPIAELQDWSS